MTSSERSDATNAIWLCRNCHKLVDADQNRFPHELLFEWRRAHDETILSMVGKAGAALRHKAAERQLAGFKDESYLAQQIVLDKPYAWEYRLTTELLRSKLHATLSRWQSLSRGLYTKPVVRIASDDVMDWWADRIHEMGEITPALSSIINEEFQASWGDPGSPGDQQAILRVCDLFAENCAAILHWEERVRFARLPDPFVSFQQLLVGVGGHLLDQVTRIPTEMSRIFSGPEKPEGTFTISIEISVPDGWNDRCQAEFDRIRKAAQSGSQWD